MRALNREDALEELIEAHAHSFAEYEAGTEQRLEWTEVHQQYVEVVESCIAEALSDFECSAEELVAYAQRHNGEGGSRAAADKLLCRLLAMGDYAAFCSLMREAHERGPMAV